LSAFFVVVVVFFPARRFPAEEVGAGVLAGLEVPPPRTGKMLGGRGFAVVVVAPAAFFLVGADVLAADGAFVVTFVVALVVEGHNSGKSTRPGGTGTPGIFPHVVPPGVGEGVSGVGEGVGEGVGVGVGARVVVAVVVVTALIVTATFSFVLLTEKTMFRVPTAALPETAKTNVDALSASVKQPVNVTPAGGVTSSTNGLVSLSTTTAKL